jgi:hypothetical protein
VSLNVLATQTVKRHAAEDLLPMLGLVAEDGSIPPDDTTVYHFEEPSRGPGVKNPNGRTETARDRSAVPEGLANLQPPTPKEEPKKRGPKPQPKVIRPRKEREVPECGSYKAYARHRRRNEPIDDACRQASREYGRSNNSEYRLRLRKQKELKRLLGEGVSPEAAAALVELVR